MKIDRKHLAFANVVIRTEVKKLRERGIIRRADAEDIASELMAQLLEVWDRFDPERGSREGFINQVVSTRLLSLLRERRAQKRRGTPRPLDADDDTIVLRRKGGRLTSQRVKIAARPYMAPALEQERPKLPLLWRNSIRKGA